MGSLKRCGAAAAVAVGILALTGCGTAAGGGQAQTAMAQSEEPMFDPCDVPEDVLLAIGVDPASEERDILGVKQPGWSLCNWNDSPGISFLVTIFATGRPLEEILTNERFIDVTPIDLAGREAFTVRETSDTRNEHCDVVLAAGPDTLMLQTSLAKGLPPSESPCPRAIENARLLERSLPR
ncbi:DUF3558 domain-containing protein [Rhodococcus spongiicola]|uniref:DUF3558 domain-containing protein n=1 Tax=Rhodococcus spongiicola TaxID=2487352 RepID=A0A438AU51_9NOCA|nr:DUF3558 domain-containing protein [Rhodococcus spongiicola]RVW02283.1 DUF3558 domain-containing protein [Rhodococcus spongiicola]